MRSGRVSRRQFLHSVAAAAAVAPFVSTSSKTAPATVRHGAVGGAGQASYDLSQFAKHPAFELVCVADVDLCRVQPLQQQFPKVRVYQDWREMFARERGNIDSVSVTVPDHMHFPIAMEAMKLRKSVYVQKPLCNTLREVRLLTEQARRRKVTSQMGIQVSSSRVQRYGEALIRSGVIGKVREVHTFSNKNWGDDKPLPEAEDPVPAALDWDGWLGVSAPRPFKKGVYHPGEWRRRVGFGTGTLGDMGCHIYSPPYRALKLTSPRTVTSYGPSPSDVSWATRARVKLTYPGTEFTADKTIDVWWYDGGELPPVTIQEAIEGKLPPQGSVIVGTDGYLVLPHGSADPFVFPVEKTGSLPVLELPDRDHYGEFVDAVLGGSKQKCSADFDYAGPLTESVLIGNVAARFPDVALEFDARKLSFPRNKDANAFLTRAYRGFHI
jgi:predicted dehydrogenase